MTDRQAPRRAPAPRGGPRVDQQPAFVVHSTPWRETSLVVEALTRDHGRVALVARGAKRPTSQFRGLLVPFNPLALTWSGRGEVKSLVRVDWLGGLVPLRGEGLLSAFYLNELVVRLVSRGDPHEALFGSYLRALHDLASPMHAHLHGPTLRGFELDLLREIGYGVALDVQADGEPLRPEAWYRVDPIAGPVPVDAVRRPFEDHVPGIRGIALERIAARDFTDPQIAADARRLLQRLIGYHLDGRPLNTRRIVQDLRNR